MLTLYNNIKKRREELGLTKVELATRIGYERSIITKIEQGKVDLTQSKIVAFANALETTPAKLMGWENATDQATDSISNPKKEYSEFTSSEMLMVEKYRSLDNYGQEMVDLVLDKEYERVSNDYVEFAARGGKYKVKREVAERWAKEVVSDPCERDDDLC